MRGRSCRRTDADTAVTRLFLTKKTPLEYLFGRCFFCGKIKPFSAFFRKCFDNFRNRYFLSGFFGENFGSLAGSLLIFVLDFQNSAPSYEQYELLFFHN
nr:MAG TPA: hypothetical protein [Caudoviricetes sp.]